MIPPRPPPIVAGNAQARLSLTGASKMLSMPIIKKSIKIIINDLTKICPKIWFFAIVLSF